MKAVFGVTGWKNSGKTTLVCNLVREFSSRGYRVSTVKHAHEGFEIDQAGTDSYQHRHAGAGEVALAGGSRWALIHDGREREDNATLQAMIDRLSPCDLVIVEGFKGEPHPKIECRREASASQSPIWQRNQSVVAVAAGGVEEPTPLPVFDLDDVATISDFISDHVSLGEPEPS